MLIITQLATDRDKKLRDMLGIMSYAAETDGKNVYMTNAGGGEDYEVMMYTKGGFHEFSCDNENSVWLGRYSSFHQAMDIYETIVKNAEDGMDIYCMPPYQKKAGAEK